MYKQHLLDTQNLENQVVDVVKELGHTIQDLESQLRNLGVDLCTSAVSKLKATNAKIQDVAKKLLKRNTELEQTIKAQAAKIHSLENTLSELRKEMRTMKEEQAKKDQHLQKQIDEIKLTLKNRDSKIETKMSDIVTVVMAANKFKQSLEKSDPNDI